MVVIIITVLVLRKKGKTKSAETTGGDSASDDADTPALNTDDSDDDHDEDEGQEKKQKLLGIKSTIPGFDKKKKNVKPERELDPEKKNANINGKLKKQIKPKKYDAYRAALEQALEDGIITEDEENLLEMLRSKYNITENEHKMLEAQVKFENEL